MGGRVGGWRESPYIPSQHPFFHAHSKSLEVETSLSSSPSSSSSIFSSSHPAKPVGVGEREEVLVRGTQRHNPIDGFLFR